MSGPLPFVSPDRELADRVMREAPRPALKQEVICDYPPIFDDICRVFPMARNDGIVFSWGPRIFNPTRSPIQAVILAHEAVHGERQGTDEQGILDWWKRYLDDPKFRLTEEAPAHLAELRFWLDKGSRSMQRKSYRVVAHRLASPLYGNMISRSKAEAWLRAQVRR